MSICSGIEQHARGDGGIFHLTHRCHNRAFLLTFCSRSRRLPCETAAIRVTVRCLRPGLLLDLLVDATERLEVSGFMRQVADEFARAYNRRKHRTVPFGGTITTQRSWRAGNTCGNACAKTVHRHRSTSIRIGKMMGGRMIIE